MYSETVTTYIQTRLATEAIRIDIHFASYRMDGGYILQPHEYMQYADHVRLHMSFDSKRDFSLPLIAKKILHELELLGLSHNGRMTGITATVGRYSTSINV